MKRILVTYATIAGSTEVAQAVVEEIARSNVQVDVLIPLLSLGQLVFRQIITKNSTNLAQ
jgi:flavodoxin